MVQENKPGIFANLILVILMSTSISQSLYSSLFMTQKLSNTIFFAAIPMAFIIYNMFKNKITSLISAIIMALFLITSLINVWLERGNSKKILDYFNWLINLFNDQYRIDSSHYTNTTVLIILFLVTLLIFVFTVKLFNFYFISFIGIGIFFVQMQFGFFSSNAAYVLFIFSLMLYYFFSILRRRKKDNSYDIGNKLKYLVFIIPVCIIVLLISFLLPIRNNRISSEWLDTKADNTVNNVIDFFEKRFSGKDLGPLDYFSFGETGFGNSDRLGGNIKLDDTHVMNVKSVYSNLYLKATSKAFYDGYRWYDSNSQVVSIGENLKEYSAQINSDQIEFSIGNHMYLKDNKNDAIFKNTQAQIEFVDLKTKSLFIPPKLYLLELNKPLSLFEDTEKMLSANKFLDNGFEYNVNYSYLMLNSDEFLNNIRKSSKGYLNEDMIISYFQYISKNYDVKLPVLPKKVVTDDFIYYVGNMTLINQVKDSAERIYRKYTQLPNTITPRIGQLAKEITQDKATNYDKAKAIENYLSQNYSYTLKPGKPPKKQDFVDYFLFDDKEGYCTYYATAMVVLLRCIDIPARFVEGYRLPPSPEFGIYEVTNQQAHAWVEVYFEGFGWIPFEPTSPFIANMYSNRDVSANISNETQNQNYDDYLDMMNQNRNEKAEPNASNDNINTGTEDKTSSKFNVVMVMLLLISILLIGFCILAAIQRIRHQIFIKKIRNSDPNNAVLAAYFYVLEILNFNNISVNAGETPSEFGSRVERLLYFGGFLPITDHFVDARYSKAILPEKAKQEMLEFIDILLKYTYKRLSKFQIIIYKYVIGKI